MAGSVVICGKNKKYQPDTMLANREVHILNDNFYDTLQENVAMHTKTTHIGQVLG